MNLVEMRAAFVTFLAGKAADASTVDVDAYLNSNYRYTIPSLISGFLTRGAADLAVTGTASVWPLPAHVHSVLPGATLYDGTPLDEYWTIEDFLSMAGGMTAWNASSGTPEAVGYTMFAGPIGVLSAIFYPNANSTVAISVPIRAYPSSDLDTDDDLQRLHGLAVASGAALEFAEDHNLRDVAELAEKRFQRYVGLLQGRSDGFPPT